MKLLIILWSLVRVQVRGSNWLELKDRLHGPRALNLNRQTASEEEYAFVNDEIVWINTPTFCSSWLMIMLPKPSAVTDMESIKPQALIDWLEREYG